MPIWFPLAPGVTLPTAPDVQVPSSPTYPGGATIPMATYIQHLENGDDVGQTDQSSQAVSDITTVVPFYNETAGVSATIRTKVAANVLQLRNYLPVIPGVEYLLSGNTVNFYLQQIYSTGTFNVTGFDVSFSIGVIVLPDVGIFNITGNNTSLVVDRPINAELGTFALTGQNVRLVPRRAKVDIGVFSVTGPAADIIKFLPLALDVGTFNITGNDVLINRTISLETGVFTLTGNDVRITPLRLTVNVGTFNLTGYDVSIPISLAPWTPAAITVDLWLDAADDQTVYSDAGSTLATAGVDDVQQWNDKSGNARNASVSSANPPAYTSNFPGTANNAILFDDTNSEYFDLNMLFLDNNYLDIFVVSRLGASTPSLAGLYCSQTNGFSTDALSTTHVNVGGGISHALRGVASLTYNPGSNLYREAAIISHVRWDDDGSSGKEININGTFVESSGNNSQLGTMFNGGAGHIGAAWNNPNTTLDPMSGHICEVVMVLGNLSSDDTFRMEGYLAHKWGFETSLPSGHPYKDDPPTADPVPGNTVLLMHFDNNYDDASATNAGPWTNFGGGFDAGSKFGSHCFAFTNGLIFMSGSSNTWEPMNTSDFTVEFWFDPVTASQNALDTVVLMGSTNTAGSARIIYEDVGGSFGLKVIRGDNTQTLVNTSSALNTGQFYHVAVVRSGNDWKMYIDGVDTGGGQTFSYSLTDFSQVSLGGNAAGANRLSSSKIDELRIVANEAVYTGNFTPPTGPFP